MAVLDAPALQSQVGDPVAALLVHEAPQQHDPIVGHIVLDGEFQLDGHEELPGVPEGPEVEHPGALVDGPQQPTPLQVHPIGIVVVDLLHDEPQPVLDGGQLLELPVLGGQLVLQDAGQQRVREVYARQVPQDRVQQVAGRQGLLVETTSFRVLLGYGLYAFLHLLGVVAAGAALPEYIVLPHYVLVKVVLYDYPHLTPVDVVRQLAHIADLPDQVPQPHKVNLVIALAPGSVLGLPALAALAAAPVDFPLHFLPVDVAQELSDVPLGSGHGLDGVEGAHEVAGGVDGWEVPAEGAIPVHLVDNRVHQAERVGQLVLRLQGVVDEGLGFLVQVRHLVLQPRRLAHNVLVAQRHQLCWQARLDAADEDQPEILVGGTVRELLD